jgi:hypothetical protein
MELGKPDAGKPPVRFDEGRESDGHWAHALSIRRLLPTLHDGNLPGEMRTTIALTPVSCGTEIKIIQVGVPAPIPAEACYCGWQETLQLLSLLVEAQVQE